MQQKRHWTGWNAISILRQRCDNTIHLHSESNNRIRSQGRPRLKKAIAKAYSPLLGKDIDPETEVTITTGANEGMLSAFMAFIEQGDEVIIFEPFFDQ